jgi:DNA-binding beta-propeller fold protein YncE
MSNSGTSRSRFRATVAAALALLLTMLGMTAVAMAPSASAATGDLSWASCISNADLAGCTTAPDASLKGSVSAVVSPDGKNAYVTGQADGTVTVFTRNTTTGALTYDSCISNAALGSCTVAPNATMDGPYDVEVSPDGKNAYIASGPGSSTDNNLTVLSRNAATGALTVDSCISNIVHAGCTTALNPTLNEPAMVTVSPDGRNVYVTAWGVSNAVTTFARNVTTGALTFDSCISNAVLGTCVVATHASLNKPVGVSVSPDGKNVYIVGQETVGVSSVTVLNRSTSTGVLTYSACISNTALSGCTTAPSESLFNSYDVIVAPDGRNVFVSSWGNNAVTMFARDTTTGALTGGSCISNAALGSCSQAPSASMNNPDGIATSPDGKNVYLASAVSSAVTVFNRTVPAPTVTSISPVTGPVTGGNTVTITGVGFAPGVTVTIGGQPCTNAVVTGSLEITCTAPAGAAGVANVVVTNPGGQGATLAKAYTFAGLAQVPLNGCAVVPKSIPRTGTKVVLKANCVTNAGRKVKVTARCQPLLRGDLAYCSLLHNAKGKTWLRTRGYHLKITLVWSAPATATYAAYRQVKTYFT